jgi:hypothetical protein
MVVKHEIGGRLVYKKPAEDGPQNEEENATKAVRRWQGAVVECIEHAAVAALLLWRADDAVVTAVAPIPSPRRVPWRRGTGSGDGTTNNKIARKQ